MIGSGRATRQSQEDTDGHVDVNALGFAADASSNKLRVSTKETAPELPVDVDGDSRVEIKANFTAVRQSKHGDTTCQQWRLRVQGQLLSLRLPRHMRLAFEPQPPVTGITRLDENPSAQSARFRTRWARPVARPVRRAPAVVAWQLRGAHPARRAGTATDRSSVPTAPLAATTMARATRRASNTLGRRCRRDRMVSAR